MSCFTSGFKATIVLLALVQVLIAVVLIVAGAVVFVSFGNMKEFVHSTYTLVPASILISAGALLFFLGIIGAHGAAKQNKKTLSAFFVISLALFILEIVGASLALAKRENFESAVQQDFSIFIREYNESHVVKKEVDWIQRSFRCCGNANVTDWTNMKMAVPDSCCMFNSTIPSGSCNEKIVYEANIGGCGSLLHAAFFAKLNVIGGVGLAFAFIQLIALAAVVALIFRKEERYEVF